MLVHSRVQTISLFSRREHCQLSVNSCVKSAHLLNQSCSWCRCWGQQLEPVLAECLLLSLLTSEEPGKSFFFKSAQVQRYPFALTSSTISSLPRPLPARASSAPLLPRLPRWVSVPCFPLLQQKLRLHWFLRMLVGLGDVSKVSSLVLDVLTAALHHHLKE